MKGVKKVWIFRKIRGKTPVPKMRFCKSFPVNFAKFLKTPFSQNNSGGCFCTTQFTARQFKKKHSESKSEQDVLIDL